MAVGNARRGVRRVSARPVQRRSRVPKPAGQPTPAVMNDRGAAVADVYRDADRLFHAAMAPLGLSPISLLQA